MELNEEEGRGGVLWENWHFSNPSLEVRACCAVITDGAFFLLAVLLSSILLYLLLVATGGLNS